MNFAGGPFIYPKSSKKEYKTLTLPIAAVKAAHPSHSVGKASTSNHTEIGLTGITRLTTMRKKSNTVTNLTMRSPKIFKSPQKKMYRPPITQLVQKTMHSSPKCTSMVITDPPMGSPKMFKSPPKCTSTSTVVN
jgi:hypothetical protein